MKTVRMPVVLSFIWYKCKGHQVIILFLLFWSVCSFTLFRYMSHDENQSHKPSLYNPGLRKLSPSADKFTSNEMSSKALEPRSHAPVESDYAEKESDSSSIGEGGRYRYTYHLINKTRREVSFDPPSAAWSRLSCEPVYFLGGGKAGTTTLATLLKHSPPKYEKWDPKGQFSDAGKEVCWASSGHPGTPQSYWGRFRQCVPDEAFVRKRFALDGCPRTWKDSQLKTIAMVHPHTRFLMLVRDPVDRLISHVNLLHLLPSGGGRGPGNNVDKKYEKYLDGGQMSISGMSTDLSKYDRILKNFLRYFDSDQLLIIPTAALKTHAQEVLDDVMHHIGGERIIVPEAIETNNNYQKKNYARPSESMRRRLDEYYQPVRNYVQEAVGDEIEGFKNV
mmetsp:Transcript_4594/g.6138  ORF Transcript_4594/g.6138 Transcript_4594/m.6138 type:complete len:391 (+) Transcript_4594:298-1470(+)